MSRILVIGGTSSLATEFVGRHQEYELTITDRRGKIGQRLDLTDLRSMSDTLKASQFDYAIVFAGMTKIAECEQSPELAQLINCDALVELQQTLKVENWILLSTNLVFSGEIPLTAHDTPYKPFNQYGKSKANMERAFVDALPSDRLAIVRMTKVISRDFVLFQNWLKELRTGKTVEAFSDMNLSPVSSRQVVDFLGELVTMFHSGIYHLSGKTDISYYDALRELTLQNGLDPDLILATAKTVKSPKYTSLLTDTREGGLGFNAPDIHQVLVAQNSVK